jgi:glycerol dehydrogenase
MKNNRTFDPNRTYQKLPDNKGHIQLFISPHQYVQGAGVLGMMGEYISMSVSGNAGILITPGRDRALGATVEKSLSAVGMASVKTLFQGEASDAEVERVVAFFRNSESPVQGIIGIGGGKCLDTARMAASQLDVPVVTVPTTASTDAPTAAHSIVYHENGVFDRVEFCALSPRLVLVDLNVVAAAPPRYLIAGMGDACSTYFEARCCMENPSALTTRGGRPTMAALAIARQCHDVLLEHGVEALKELESGAPGPALSRIVEANILLSGIGFESGGLAGAHAVAQGLTVCHDLHKNCLHGELVAIGVLTQLIMEKRMDEARETARFFRAVGLPLHLGQLGFDTQARDAELDAIVAASLGVFFIRYEPFDVTHTLLKESIIEAGRLGKTVLEDH